MYRIEDKELTTPVAFFIYNRPECTERSFEAIKRAEPRKLFVVSDGPKSKDETERVKHTRDIVSSVTWDCEVRNNYSDINLGCGNRFITGLRWLFSQVEEAIILEDDIVPSKSFFHFCQKLLRYYRNEEKIFSVSGCNIGFSNKNSNASYTFSHFMNMWGWATWRRAFDNIDFTMQHWPDFKESSRFRSILGNDVAWINYWKNILELQYEGSIDTWDYQWIYSQLYQNGLTIIPNTNMVQNIGYGDVGTHTQNSEHLNRAQLKACESPVSIKHPKDHRVNIKYDRYIKYAWCDIPPAKIRLFRLFKRYREQLLLKPTRSIRGRLGLRRYQLRNNRN